MAYNVSAEFKAKIKDGVSAQSCLILFSDCFFRTEDFTDSGVVFNQYFNTSDDLSFGECPSDTLSFSVIANGTLKGYGFGEAKAYIGVQTASESYSFGDINAHIEVDGNTYTASASGLYRNDTKIDSGEYVSLVSDGTTVYAIGLSSSVRVVNASGAVSAYTPTRFMAQKLKSGLSAVFDGSTAMVWDGENVVTYEYVPMGVYNVKKPRSTVGDTVNIQDAYDNMSLFDRDASEFLNSLTYPKTLSQIYVALCNYIGVSYVSSTFTYSTTSYSSSPFGDNACTCRDILSWIAERARCVAHFDRLGRLELRWLGTAQETITASDIAQSGYSMAEYKTSQTTGVLLKSTQGASLSFGDMTNPYSVYANPFVSTITDTDLQAYRGIMTYVPLEVNVIEADPSVDVGDLINVHPMVEEIVALTNVYGEIYAKDETTAYATDTPTYNVPLMTRELHFNGAVSAKYSATGNETREIDDDISYNASIAVSPDKATSISEKAASSAVANYDTYLDQEKVFNRLTNNGELQGIYMSGGEIYVNAEYIKTGYLSADRIEANSIAVSKLTGSISNGNWNIDLDAGTFTIGNISAANITTGTLSADRIGANSIAVGKLTGSVTGGLSNSWVINLTDGTMTVGNISAANITTGTLAAARIAANSIAVGKLTGSISNGNWKIDLDAGTFTIGNISAANITTGTLDAARIGANSITASKLDVSDLQAIGATIGGFAIDSTSIHTKDVAITSNASNSVGLSSSTFTRTIGGTSRSSLKFAIGSKFAVANDGTVYASSLTLTGGSIALGSNFSVTSAGEVTAKSGTIGGFNITSSAIYSGANLTDGNDGDIAISTADFERVIRGGGGSNLRFAIGSCFGVSSEGIVYCYGIHGVNAEFHQALDYYLDNAYYARFWGNGTGGVLEMRKRIGVHPNTETRVYMRLGSSYGVSFYDSNSSLLCTIDPVVVSSW